MCKFKEGDLVIQRRNSMGNFVFPEYASTIFKTQRVFALDYEDEDRLFENEDFDWALEVESLDKNCLKFILLEEEMQLFKPSVFTDKKYENLYE